MPPAGFLVIINYQDMLNNDDNDNDDSAGVESLPFLKRKL